MSFFRILAAVVGSLVGALLFLHYFLPLPTLDLIAQPLLSWVVLLSGAVLVMASGNLVWRHARTVRRAPLAGLVVVGFLLTFGAGLLPGGMASGLSQWLYRWGLAPGLAAVFALLPIFLAAALYRRLNIRDAGLLVFALGFLIVMLGQTPLLAARIPFLAALRHNVFVGPGAAAMRGVLIGAALGVVLATLRRPRIES